MNDEEIGYILRTFKIEMQKGGPNNSDFLQNWFSLEIRFPSLICRHFKTLRKVPQNHAECIKM